MPTLESKSEIKHNILKFTNQINNALTQAYGNVTIYVPPSGDGDDHQVNPAILKQYQSAVVSLSFLFLLFSTFNGLFGLDSGFATPSRVLFSDPA